MTDEHYPDESAHRPLVDDRTLRALIDLIPAGVVVAEARGTITMWNSAAEAILGTPITGTTFGPAGGYTVHRLDGSPFPPRDLPLPRAIEHGESILDVEVIVRHANGLERTILVSASPIQGRTGGVSGGIAIFQDVTEQRNTLRLLEARELQQDAIAKVGREALAGTFLPRLLDDAVRLVADVVNVESAAVLELLPDRSDFLLSAGVGWKPGIVGHTIVEGGPVSFAGFTLQSVHPVVVEDLPNEIRFQASPLLLRHGVVSCINVLIQGHPRPVGILGAYARRRCQFSVDDVSYIQTIANTLAMAIERNRTEDDLRRQAQIIDQVHDAVISTDIQGRVTRWNKGAEETYGYTASEALGRHISFVYPASAYPGGVRDFVDHQVIAPLLARGNHQVEVTLQHKSGRHFIANLRLSVLRNQGGQITGLIGYSIDITARKQAEDELRRTEEHLRSVTSNAPIVLFALDANGIFTLSTGKGLEALGLKPGEVVGRSIFDLYASEPDVLEHAHRALAGESITTVDTVAPGLVWETRWSVVRNPRGYTTGVIGVATNITERFRAEQARAELLTRAEAIAKIAQALVRERELAKLVDVIIAQSQEALHADVVGIWLANPARRELTLVSSRGAIPKATELSQRLAFDAPVLTARAARTGQPQMIEDVRDGHERLAIPPQLAETETLRSVLALPLKTDGDLVGVVTYQWHLPRRFTSDELAFDLTVADLFAVALQNARLDEELRDTLRLHEEFMASAAHELRTPLTVIMGRAQIRLRGEVKELSVRQALEVIDRQAERISRLADDLLTILQLRPGHANLHCETFDLGLAIQAAIAQISAESPELQFQVDTDRSAIVDADPVLTGVVLSRLLENAAWYSPAHGHVEIRVRHVDDEVVVSITDHGPGIASERLRHVFDPFFQPVPPGAPGYVGNVSLGLHLSKQIVDAHQGQIWVTSTPGEGTTFSFSLGQRPL